MIHMGSLVTSKLAETIHRNSVVQHVLCSCLESFEFHQKQESCHKLLIIMVFTESKIPYGMTPNALRRVKDVNNALGGNLNLTIKVEEIWGVSSKARFIGQQFCSDFENSETMWHVGFWIWLQLAGITEVIKRAFLSSKENLWSLVM